MSVSPVAAVAGTFALLVVALVVFVVVFVRTSRSARGEKGAVRHSVGAQAAGKVDTNLEGLDITVAEDSPSAALLAPLRESEWMPPETPAPAEHLPKVNLDTRIAEYKHPVHVDEPSFAVDAYPSWQVAGAHSGRSAPAAEPDWAPTVPEVRPSTDVPATQAVDADDRFSAEIAALLPDIPPELAPLAAGALGAHAEPHVPAPTPEPAPAPEPTRKPPAEPEPAPAPEPTPEPASAPEPTPEPSPEPAPWLPPKVEAYPAAPADPTIAPETPATEQPADLSDAFWAGLLAEQQGSEAAGALAAAATSAASTMPPSRPTVKVTSAEPPAPSDTTSFAAQVAVQRPRATVRVSPIPEDLSSRAASDHARAANVSEATMGLPTSADVPELELETPVEMWFGDARVGVKPGSATDARFRKYADVLFADLNESRTRADNL